MSGPHSCCILPRALSAGQLIPIMPPLLSAVAAPAAGSFSREDGNLTVGNWTAIPCMDGVIRLSGSLSARITRPVWSAINVPNVNTLRPRQNGRHFPDDTFKCIFMNENVRISINISLKFVSKGLINNIPALVHIMAWRRPGDKPLSGPMMVNLLTPICVTRPQWVKGCRL